MNPNQTWTRACRALERSTGRNCSRNAPWLGWYLGLIFLFVCFSGRQLLAQEDGRWTAKPSDDFRFTTLKVFVESGTQPLAAYQLTLTLAGSDRIVGIEGGESAVFRQPPSYDPQAIDHDRVILAAFSTEPPERLPKGKVLVATIHAKVRRDRSPRVQVKMQTAAGTDGEPIQAQAQVVEGTAK